jgi:hypothetical protein
MHVFSIGKELNGEGPRQQTAGTPSPPADGCFLLTPIR